MPFDHQYIEEHHVAERYLSRTLAPQDRTRFEEHFPDCPECLDRLALAEMFRGNATKSVAGSASREEPSLLRDILTRLAALSHLQLRIVLWLALLLLAGAPLAFVAGVYIGLDRARASEQQSKSSLVVDPDFHSGIESYGVAVTNASGKVISATTGIQVRPGQLITIPMEYASLPPGDYTVTLRARLLDGSILVLKSYQIRNQPR